MAMEHACLAVSSAINWVYLVRESPDVTVFPSKCQLSAVSSFLLEQVSRQHSIV